MEPYLIHFLMALTLFGCCYLINIKTSAAYIGVPSLVGIFASVGFMFYSLYQVAL